MYPLPSFDLTDRAANEPSSSTAEARPSMIRLRARDDDDSERATLPPHGVEPRPDPAALVDEVLFRFRCGDRCGAVVAADPLLPRVPVVVMDRADLRAEPMGYWELHLLSLVDGDSTLADLLDDTDMPLSDAVRVVCELLERKIVVLR